MVDENILALKAQPNDFSYRKDEVIYREKLQAVVAEALQKPVVTIVAPPGYGKSTAVASFLADKQDCTLWISLTQMDDVVTRFWERFVKIISFRRNDFAQKLIAIGFPESDVAFEKFMNIISKEIYKHERYYIVLDDFYMITNQLMINFFEKVIFSRLKGVCIILISRYQLPVNTISLLAKNLLYRINMDVLRLTEEEMQNFFKMKGIILSSQAAYDFYIYTDGWVFATQLVCLSLEKGVMYHENPFSTVKLDIFSLLQSEIFSALSDELQKFMLKLSLLESLPTELLILLAGKNPSLVDKALNISSFVMFDSFTNTYHIHNIFLSFLREKHSTLLDCETKEIYTIAAQWYAQNGYRIDAITYYEKIKHYKQVVEIVLTYTGRFTADTINFLLGVIDRIPDELREEKPILHVLYAKYLLNNFRLDEAYKKLEKIKSRFEAMPLSDENKMVLGEAYIMLAFQSMIISPFIQKFEFTRYFKKADEYLPLGSKLNAGLGFNMGNYICNMQSREKNESDKVLAAIKYTEPYCSRVLDGWGTGFEFLSKAEYAYFQHDMKNAEKYAHKAFASSHAAKESGAESYAMFLLTRINMCSGSYSKVRDVLNKQKKIAQKANYTEDYAVYDMTVGWFYAKIGQTDLVPEWLKDDIKRKEVMSPITFAADHLIYAICLLADKKYYQLIALTDNKKEGINFETYLFGIIEMKVLRAIALNLVKEPEEAAEVFREAYELAYPNDIIMPFIEYGNYTRTLIGAVSKYCNIPTPWLENIKIKASTYAKRIGSIASDYRALNTSDLNKPSLTKREKDILQGICQGLTRAELADNGGISVNSVKKMILNIYFKLGVNNNFDAVRVSTIWNLIN